MRFQKNSRASYVFDAGHAKLSASVQEFERHNKAKCGDLPQALLIFIAMVKHSR
jgi:hypothetical protein